MVYITTPIYYPNGKPHLGSAYTTLAADSLARLYKLFGYEVFFLTGTDEHGEKLQREAERRGKTPKEFVDEMSLLFKDAWKKLKIEYDFFIRTTDERHAKVVKDILAKVYERGYIYKGLYEGYYCVSCERYYTEKELKDGLCPYHYKPVEKKRVESYFFKLSLFKEKLLSFYGNNDRFLPPLYKEEIINRVREGLKDLSISRPKDQVYWGIELPFDSEHVSYVWFDALLNYYSAPKIVGNNVWPPDIQIMGKDIIWFHTVIWPAMLMALGEALPRREVAHGFLTVDGKKMSKSLGNVVDPLEVSYKYSSDALRYYLLIKLSFGGDGDFSWRAFKEVYEKELIGDIGNLARRIMVLKEKIGLSNGKGVFVDERERLKLEMREALERYDVESIFNDIYPRIFSLFRRLNAFLNEREPWKSKDRQVVGDSYDCFKDLIELVSPILVEGYERFLKGESILYRKVQ